MYSLEERQIAVNTYYELGKNAKATVRRLGYPDESNLSRWVKAWIPGIQHYETLV